MESKINDKQGRYWSQSEHLLFLEGLKIFGARDLRRIALHVGTRSVVQTRTHAQKYFLKLEREKAKREKQELTNQKLRNTQTEMIPNSPPQSPSSLNNSMSQLATAALFEMSASVSSPSGTNSPSEALSPQQSPPTAFVQSFNNLPQLMVQTPTPIPQQQFQFKNSLPTSFDESEALASLKEFAAPAAPSTMKFPSIANLLNDREFTPSLAGTDFCRLPAIQLKH